ncbi:MAG: RagB/SusD family nutrient uptake outer membrane protein [Mucilaginibacter sp.]|jgi:hypothetical protein|nr:RagB/SusD family nutrient uptake outer membrane protein [Mucilaginibacter sp.]
MKKLKILMVMLVIIPLASCQKFLEKEPKIQTDIQTADELDDLINNATAFTYDGANSTAAYSTDDTEVPLSLYQNNLNSVSIANLYYYIFDVNNIAGASADALWNGEYKKIFTANVILTNIDKVTGSATQKNRIKADAYFIRAYCYWNLVNYYCMPYAAENMQGQGLPLKKTTDYTESLKRATLQETYDFILSDIAQAQSLVTTADVQANARWRITKPGIDAFLSRFYLFTGDYTKSLQYANSALTSSVAQLVDYNTIAAGNPAAYTNPAATLKYSVLNDWAAAQFLYWNEFYYTRFTYTSAQWFIPSTNLLSLYDTQNDQRYLLFMIANGGRRFSVITPATYRYDMFNDGRYLPTGPTVAEVLLNKAEASARTGDVTTAMTSVNLLRAKRLKTYVALTATDKADALTKVLLERRRELPFSFRWWDIRRFSVNDDPTDDVVVSRTFFKMGVGTVDVTTTQTYTLPLKSTRYMVPINLVEISSSQGQIQQNNY